MKRNILFNNSAVKEVLQYLERCESYKHRHPEYINQGRYAVVPGQPNIAIIFKKEWFMKFAEVMRFKGFEEKGIGDSINCEDLKLMIKRDVKKIYMMHSSGKIYSIDLIDFLCKSNDWENKEGKKVRSISIHNYKRVNEDECFT